MEEGRIGPRRNPRMHEESFHPFTRCFHLKRENLSTFFLRDKASINKESVRGT
jgi:hypothetical protein